MKILIADDEQPARARLRSLVLECSGCEVVGEAANGREALLMCSSDAPDIVLLDIRMPAMDGLETAMHLTTLEHPPAVIFTTAYGDYALEAFETHAVDYLLKPIRRERLEQALAKACKLTRAQIARLDAGSGKPRARTHICVRWRGNLQLVPVADIRYFQADQKYVTVCFPGGQVLIEESLRALEQEFGEAFTRIHRNALVANAHLTGLVREPSGHFHVSLRGIAEQLEVSRRHAPALRRRLKDLRA